VDKAYENSIQETCEAAATKQAMLINNPEIMVSFFWGNAI
jgi:hypothetical protein